MDGIALNIIIIVVAAVVGVATFWVQKKLLTWRDNSMKQKIADRRLSRVYKYADGLTIVLWCIFVLLTVWSLTHSMTGTQVFALSWAWAFVLSVVLHDWLRRRRERKGKGISERSHQTRPGS